MVIQTVDALRVTVEGVVRFNECLLVPDVRIRAILNSVPVLLLDGLHGVIELVNHSRSGCFVKLRVLLQCNFPPVSVERAMY